MLPKVMLFIGHARAGPEPMNSGNSEIVRGIRRALDVPHVEHQDDEVIVLGPAPLGTKFIIVVLGAAKAVGVLQQSVNAIVHAAMQLPSLTQLSSPPDAALASSGRSGQTLGISCHEIGDDPASTGPPLPVMIADFRDNVRRSDHDAPQGVSIVGITFRH